MSERKLKVSNYQGRRTFDFIIGQISSCISDIKLFFKIFGEGEIFQEGFLKSLRIINEKHTCFSPVELAKMDIAYIIVFMGLRRAGQKAIEAILTKFYKPEFLEKLLFYISKKPHADSDFYEIWEGVHRRRTEIANKSNATSHYYDSGELLKDKKFVELVNNNISPGYNKYYGGFQYQLSHYFRHLFQSVKYINNKDILIYNEKKELIDLLRAQISTPEQILFFFNSISSLGRDWEYTELLKKGNEACADRMLVTKYNLIRNIHDTKINGIVDVKKYYPYVHFEFEDCPKGRKKFENSFM